MNFACTNVTCFQTVHNTIIRVVFDKILPIFLGFLKTVSLARRTRNEKIECSNNDIYSSIAILLFSLHIGLHDDSLAGILCNKRPPPLNGASIKHSWRYHISTHWQGGNKPPVEFEYAKVCFTMNLLIKNSSTVCRCDYCHPSECDEKLIVFGNWNDR